MPRGSSSLDDGVTTSVGVTAVELNATTLGDRQGLIIWNTHATAKIYVGGTNAVDIVGGTTPGIEIHPGQKLTMTEEDCPQNKLWCISDTASTTVVVHRID